MISDEDKLRYEKLRYGELKIENFLCIIKILACNHYIAPLYLGLRTLECDCNW